MSIFNEKRVKPKPGHYAVLVRLAAEWEESFSESSRYRELLDEGGVFSLSALLYKRLCFLFSNTVDYLFEQSLAEYNPLFKGNSELAPKRIRDEVSEELKKRLCERPELLFEGRELLRGYYANILSLHNEAVEEMLSRIADNRKNIAETFFGGMDPGRISNISADGADCHNGGRYTAVIQTESGSFVYKPRSLKTDRLFKELTDSLLPGVLTVPGVIDCGEYGFAEFIAAHRAETMEESETFIRNLGSASCLLYVLGSMDFHAENLLPDGTRPAVIDLETLLCPQVKKKEDEAPEEKKLHSFFISYEKSIMRSGLLPKRIGGEEYSPLISEGKLSILPLVDGRVITAEADWNNFTLGFRKAYECCLEKASEIAEWAMGLSNCRVRAVLRNTDDYARQLQRLYTVTALGAEEITETLLNNMKTEYPQLSQADNESLAASERAALRRGDIPYFYVHGGGRTLYGEKSLSAENFASDSGIGQLRLNRLSAADCEYQLELIRQAILFSPRRAEKNEKIEIISAGSGNYAAEAKELLSYIRSMGVITPEGSTQWFGIQDDSGAFTALSPSFDTGTAGIALFCAEYYALFGGSEAQETCEAAMAPTLALADLIASGSFSAEALKKLHDIAGIIRSLIRISELLGNKDYIRKAERLTERLAQLPAECFSGTDFYTGKAGLLYEICAHSELKGCPGREGLIIRLADSLLSERRLFKNEAQPGWDTMNKKRLISGLGHGQAGIALALFAADAALGKREYSIAAESALLIESEKYSERLGTWPDLRSSSYSDTAMDGLCSGAPGMGLAYILMKRLGASGCEQGLERAIKAVCGRPAAVRDHLCCGKAASVEFLLEAAKETGGAESRLKAESLAALMLAEKNTRGSFLCMPQNFRNNTPVNLFFGAAGIGHILLRLISHELKSVFG